MVFLGIDLLLAAELFYASTCMYKIIEQNIYFIETLIFPAPDISPSITLVL